MNRPRLVVCCVDGGVAPVVRQHGLFDPGRWFPARAATPATPLTSVFPSSTAPAHASFLTGAHPERHGVVGNRFWSGEPVAEVLRRRADPVETLHPYERTSLLTGSLLDWFAARGACVAAVHFPHTFSRSEPGIPALHCLYAPARRLVVPLTTSADGVRAGSASTTYFQHPLRLDVRAEGDRFRVSAAHGPALRLDVGATGRLDTTNPLGRLSFALTPVRAGSDRVELAVGTCVLVLPFGGLAPSVLGGPGPASLGVSYPANPGHDFHESPRADWVARAALEVLGRHDPDVLLVRFNQADHAQEFLGWHATRADPATRSSARGQITDAYHEIDAGARSIAEAVGPDADLVFFSDHGIDWVETHLRPNEVLAALGLADRLVFQGDSNCAFLYGDAPPEPAELAAITSGLAELGAGVLDADALRAWRLPVGGPRVGHLVVTCGAHTEFQYGDGPATEAVRSASHGHLPTDPAMSGFFRMSGPGADGLTAPEHLVDAASVVRAIWCARRGGDPA